MANYADGLTARDTQRARLYAADDVIEKYSKPYPEMEDMVRFVKKVWSSKRLQKDYPVALGNKWRFPVVKDGRGRSAAGGWSGGITMPLWSRKTNVLLHELAHTINARENYDKRIAGHGWEFAAVYLRLVLVMMGRQAHDEMKASFKKHRVRFTAPRKSKPMDPERKAALVARLAAYRAAKAEQIAV